MTLQIVFLIVCFFRFGDINLIVLASFNLPFFVFISDSRLQHFFAGIVFLFLSVCLCVEIRVYNIFFMRFMSTDLFCQVNTERNWPPKN